jgi:hypothetical protein
MKVVHCTNCDAEGNAVPKGGCLYKLSWIFILLCTVVAVISYLVHMSAETELQSDTAILLMLCGCFGAMVGGFFVWLTSNPGCSTCSSTNVVAVKKWNKMHPHGDGNRKSTRKCPACAEEILLEAKKCRFCGESMPE